MDGLCPRSWYPLLEPHDPVIFRIKECEFRISAVCRVSGLCSPRPKMNQPEEKIPDSLDGQGAKASVLPSSQFDNSGCKKTSRVNMDTLKVPVPAAGVTGTFRVSFKDCGEQCKDAASNTIIPFSDWTASSLDETEASSVKMDPGFVLICREAWRSLEYARD